MNESDFPPQIAELIANINKPFKGMRDKHNPDGTKFTRTRALQATREHVADFAREYLPEASANEIHQLMLNSFRRILAKKYRDQHLREK